ncbi:MAG: restriction endonuclease subunit S [Candidatus Thiodiazotropha taylori]|nr:restriction endonuclease subunit S [Candidatus Thiodiazotropha taylori]
MGRYRAYPEYKDSGVEWLGEIPKHWFVAPFKWQIERNDGGVWGDDPDGIEDTIVLRSTEQTVDGDWMLDDPAPRKINASDKAFALLKTGDLLVTKSSGSSLHIGKTTLVSPEIEAMGCCYSNFMQRIRTKNSLMPKLAWYVMNNELARRQFDFLSNSTTGLANLNGTMMGQILLTVPEIEEQQRIIVFLDHETAKIDTLIEKQQQLIKLLKEKRQAVISHAVTKGLNPDAPMRDSGVEWLGVVPEGWDITEIRYLTTQVGGGTPSKDNPDYWNGDIPWVSPKDMKVDYIESAQDKITEKAVSESSTKLIQAGSILIVVRGMILIHSVPVALTLKTVTVNQDMKALIPVNGVNGEYLLFLLKGFRDYILDLVESSAHGTKCLRTEAFERMTVAIPCVKNQIDIVNKLKKKLNTIDLLIDKSVFGIELLQERRTALISAAVTGKIDVRDWVAPAPQTNKEDAA